MEIKPIPLFTPVRLVISLAVGLVGSWRLHASIHSVWLEARVGRTDEAGWIPPVVHWVVAAYSTIMAASACWLALVFFAVLLRRRDGVKASESTEMQP